MAKKEILEAPALPPGPTPEVPTQANLDWFAKPEIRLVLEMEYNKRMEKAAGLLRNKFISYISESKLPLSLVLLVFSLLTKELEEECQKKYLGEK